MSQFITESQAFHQNTFNTEPPICTTVQHSIFNISTENNEIPLIDELLSAEKQTLMINGNDQFGSTFDGKEEQVKLFDSSSDEALPHHQINVINNNTNDIKNDLENENKMHNHSFTSSDQHSNYESERLPPIFAVDHVINCDDVSSSHVTLSGADVSDIPTSYVIPKLAAHEKAVVGTFVDLMITPGYPYKVRRNGTNDFLFGGKPLTLISVGQGYGKRLTFHSEDILNNNHYFWSDSNPPNGFALSICLNINGEFLINTHDGRTIGRSAVTSVNEEQIINKIRCPLKNEFELEVKVQFTCNLSRDGLQSDLSAVTLQGVAIAKKSKQSAVVTRIENVIVPGCGECVLEKKEK